MAASKAASELREKLMEDVGDEERAEDGAPFRKYSGSDEDFLVEDSGDSGGGLSEEKNKNG